MSLRAAVHAWSLRCDERRSYEYGGLMIWIAGNEYGTAAEIAQGLGPDVTADRVRDWARRSANPADTLHGLLPRHHATGRGRGTTWYRFDQAAKVEAITRRAKGGPPRTGTLKRPSASS